jgi:hypothetical protein
VALRGSNHIVRECRIYQQGQIAGLGLGKGQNNLAENNEMFENCVPQVGFDGYWWGAACKFVGNTGLIVTGQLLPPQLRAGTCGATAGNNIHRVRKQPCGVQHPPGYFPRDQRQRENPLQYRAQQRQPRKRFAVAVGRLRSRLPTRIETEVYNNVVEVHDGYGNAITITNQQRGKKLHPQQSRPRQHRVFKARGE